MRAARSSPRATSTPSPAPAHRRPSPSSPRRSRKSAPPGQRAEQELDRSLELVERRVLDAADPGRAVQPAVDLRVAALVAAAQVGDEPVALVAQERAALEGRRLRGLGLRL